MSIGLDGEVTREVGDWRVDEVNISNVLYNKITMRNQVTLAVDYKCSLLRNSRRTFHFHQLPHRGAVHVPKIIRVIAFICGSREDLTGTIITNG